MVDATLDQMLLQQVRRLKVVLQTIMASALFFNAEDKLSSLLPEQQVGTYWFVTGGNHRTTAS